MLAIINTGRMLNHISVFISIAKVKVLVSNFELRGSAINAME